MKLNRNDYTVEAAAGGGFYAYFMNNVLCSAYGETPDEACETWNRLLTILSVICIWSRNLSDIPASYADRIILLRIYSINSLEVMSARCRCDFCHL